MNKNTLAIYRKLRADPVSCLVGRDAEMALRDARTIDTFQTMQAAGLVRIQSEDECDNYFDVYGKEENERDQKQMEETLRRCGCVTVYTEWFNGEDWEQADSIGMCVYDRPESPFENCYVSQLMAAAVEAARNHAIGQREDLCLALGEAECVF